MCDCHSQAFGICVSTQESGYIILVILLSYHPPVTAFDLVATFPPPFDMHLPQFIAINLMLIYIHVHRYTSAPAYLTAYHTIMISQCTWTGECHFMIGKQNISYVFFCCGKVVFLRGEHTEQWVFLQFFQWDMISLDDIQWVSERTEEKKGRERQRRKMLKCVHLQLCSECSVVYVILKISQGYFFLHVQLHVNCTELDKYEEVPWANVCGTQWSTYMCSNTHPIYVFPNPI